LLLYIYVSLINQFSNALYFTYVLKNHQLTAAKYQYQIQLEWVSE